MEGERTWTPSDLNHPIGPLMCLCCDAHSISFWVYLGTGNSVGKGEINAPNYVFTDVVAAFAALSAYLFP